MQFQNQNVKRHGGANNHQRRKSTSKLFKDQESISFAHSNFQRYHSTKKNHFHPQSSRSFHQSAKSFVVLCFCCAFARGVALLGVVVGKSIFLNLGEAILLS
jgi:hypothetical protein